jgi:hypothetical protein
LRLNEWALADHSSRRCGTGGSLNVPRARAWLFRIATNAAYDHFRQRRRLPTTQLTELHMETLAAATVPS